MPAPIIGIDLGTTNSCAAYVDDNEKVILIPYRGGEFTIPSIFAIDQKGNELVGYEAKRQWQLNPQNTIYGAKRLIGHSFDNEIVDYMKEYVAYEMVPGDQNDIQIAIKDKKYDLISISSKILSTILKVACEYLKQDISRAVVTVPAYFNDRQRQAVKEAGKRIGLEIVSIINEPTSAALAFGANKAKNETLAVYDLGGGTFDISIIEIRNQVFEVKATGGDIFLGGLDFDKEIMNYLCSEFLTQTQVDLQTDPVAMQRIKDMAEQCKIELSDRDEFQCSIPFITMGPEGNPLDLNVAISRELFEELVSPLINKTIETAEMVIYDAEINPRDIDEVLLVGGQTRMPLLHQRLTQFFGKPPSKQIHPDEAVAIGAALYAHSLEDNSNLKLQLLDVIPMAIGIADAEGNMHQIFKRNEPIPNQTSKTFTTSQDNQKHLMMRLYQGDKEMAMDNELLGRFAFSGIRPGPKGSVKVETIFTLNGEGILSLNAVDPETGTTMEQEVSITGSTPS